jgi:endonuclease/exonuclease/phosphatase family metal-dependent hydrolase
MRALTLNLFGHDADWPARRQVLTAGLRRLRPDVVALQEAIVDDAYDQAAELLGPDYHLAHQTRGLIADGRHHGASVASRWPILEVHEVDLHLTPRTGNYSAVAVVRRIEQLVAGQPAHVIVGGDFNATPDTSSMWFWTGRRSLDGTSTAYRDCWESIHGSEPGLTFEPRNPLSAVDEPGLDRGRRIDYLLVRGGDHGPTLRIADCRRVFDEPVGGVMASDHYGVLADLEARTP